MSESVSQIANEKKNESKIRACRLFLLFFDLLFFLSYKRYCCLKNASAGAAAAPHDGAAPAVGICRLLL